MASKIFILLLLMLSLTSVASAWPLHQLHLEIFDMKCSILTSLVQTLNCTHYQGANEAYHFSFLIKFSQNINDQLELRVRIDWQHLNQRVLLHVLDYKFDVCRNLKNTFQNVFMHIMMLELRRSSNLPYACPFRAQELYKVENFTLTREIFPSYIQEMNFTVFMDFFYKGVHFAKEITTGAIHLKGTN